MLKISLSILLLITFINCSDTCKEDGLFENSGDRTSYYECANGKSHFRRCPITEDGLSYMVFDGKQCIDSYPTFVCPQESGDFRHGNSETQYYECVDSKPILKSCPQNYKFDGLECVELDVKLEIKTDELINMQDKEEEDEEDEFTCPNTTGVYSNPDDRHSYYECKDSESRLRLCPREKHGHGAQGKHRRRMIWDGHQCVRVHRSVRRVSENKNYMFNCPEPDGQYPYVNDSHYYYICENNVPRPAVCPGETLFNEAEHECIDVPDTIKDGPITYPLRRQVPERGDITCPSATIFDPSTGKCRREDFADPITEGQPAVDSRPQCPAGTVYDVNTGKCRGEDLTNPIVVSRPVKQGRPECPTDTVYDSATGQCKREILVDPIRNVVVQPQVSASCPPGYFYNTARGVCAREIIVDPIIARPVVQPNTRCPLHFIHDVARGRCVRLTSVDPLPQVRTCQTGYRWDASLGRCESSGRYRRNGRVETEDTLNGAVIVDTWNELQWRWDRNPNGERILPDVNGWLDRSSAYANARTNENEQYVRQRPVQ